MYKMIICLNEEKIIKESELKLETIYEKLDTIFGKRGFTLSMDNDRRVYSGTGADKKIITAACTTTVSFKQKDLMNLQGGVF